jgi:hypothetical protein
VGGMGSLSNSLSIICPSQVIYYYFHTVL